MTKVKFCGLSRLIDIEYANALKPDYIGFVFAQKSKRLVTPDQAAMLKKHLNQGIIAVGVFVDEKPEKIVELLDTGIIDMAQLHGKEDALYLERLRSLTSKPIIKAFRIQKEEDVHQIHQNKADFVLLDSGSGSGNVFDWHLIQDMKRPYFLAGGLSKDNVRQAVRILKPYAVDVSSGIETNGMKDFKKMADFMAAVKEVDNQ